MVDFNFDIRPLFKQSIIKVQSSLLPHTFCGDRTQFFDTRSKISEIIDRLGKLSANAQKLNKPITTAERLQMSDNQVIYIIADIEDGKNGTVIGLLKVGSKDLYLFDEVGQMHKKDNVPSILDFYIHESRRRLGLGKKLFENMLADKAWTPLKCSIDRPSTQLLAFLKKHYGLVRTIPQSNFFVIYKGFFDEDNKRNTKPNDSRMRVTNCLSTQLFDATHSSGTDGDNCANDIFTHH